MLSATDRDCLAGWGSTVYLMYVLLGYKHYVFFYLQSLLDVNFVLLRFYSDENVTTVSELKHRQD